MQQNLDKVMHSGENGLYLCQLPTGYGKSYGAMQAIAAWLQESDNNRKIIYLTTLTKNLPDDTLKSMLSPELYETNVLRLRSNLDEVSEKLPDLDVPDEFRTDCYDALLKAIRAMQQAEQNQIRDIAYLNELRNRVMDTERQFRHEIMAALRLAGKTKAARLACIHTQKRWRWVGQLYPAVYTDSRCVLFMTVKKFLGKNAVLIEPSYDFMKASFLNNAIILIDEFDATKQVILEHILEQSLSAQSEYLALFRQLLDGLHPERFSALIRNSSTPELTKLIDDGHELSNRCKLHLSYKTAKSASQQNFLFHDGSFHTVLQEGKQYLRTCFDQELNRIAIHFETKEEYYRNRKPDDIQLYTMLRDVQSYLNRFRLYLYQWAEIFRKTVNAGRSETEDEMTPENAQRSILHALHLNESQIRIMLGELSPQGLRSRFAQKKGAIFMQYTTTQLQLTKSYPTYQLYLAASSRTYQPDEILRFCILATLSWFRSRLRGFPDLPEEIRSPEPENFREFPMESLHSLTFEAGGSVDVIWSQKHKVWSFCVTETDMGANT